MTLGEATEAYQAQLEHVRAAREEGVDSDVIEELEQDLSRANKAMEVAWLESACSV